MYMNIIQYIGVYTVYVYTAQHGILMSDVIIDTHTFTGKMTYCFYSTDIITIEYILCMFLWRIAYLEINMPSALIKFERNRI